MANKVTSVQSLEVLQTNRFEPRYFYNRHLLTDTFVRFGFSVITEISNSPLSGSTPEHFDERQKASDAYFIKSADVKRYNLNKTTISYVTETVHKKRRTKYVYPQDILVSNTGKYLGFACIIPNNIPESTTNQNISTLRLFDNDKFTPEFVAAYLNSYFGQREIESLLTLTGQKYLNSSNFKRLRVPKLNNEQIEVITGLMQSILEKETTAVGTIEQAQQLFYSSIGIDFKAIAKENTFSVCKSNFADADLWTPMYSYPLYVNTLKAIQSKWQTVTIGEIATLKKGDEVGSDTYIGYLDKRKTDVPFVRTSDIVNYEIDQYPDFFIPKEIYDELGQGFQSGDVLFTKDGKIGMVGMITDNDKAIISSGFVGLSLNKKAQEYGVTPEYLFLTLSIKEIGIYASKRRTVVASTIPHLREERLKEIEIPILDGTTITEITDLVKQAFKLKDEKKRLISEVRETMDGYFEI
ncbi:MAG: hypothetical protein E7076_08925 [Bacteroidales bacterium]|nr:hypothetical protein [Bacteroidales bacterium]